MPTCSEATKRLRLEVARAYQAARCKGISRDDAIEAAMTIYVEAHPTPWRSRSSASEQVAEIIASVTNADPKWFIRAADGARPKRK
jgi:hypothetical protein